MKRLFILVYFAIFTIDACCQSVEQQTTLWYRLYATKALSQNLQVGLLIEDRKYLNPWRSHIFLTELNLQQKFAKKWTVGLHGTYLIFALPHDPTVESFRMDEIRMHQSITFPQIHLRNLGVSVRSMAEQRFFAVEGEDGHMSDFDYTFFRWRNRLKMKIPLANRLSTVLTEEYMIQARPGEGFHFDQNRAGASLMLEVTRHMSLEVGYLHWYQVRPTVRYSRHSLRTGIYLQL